MQPIRVLAFLLGSTAVVGGLNISMSPSLETTFAPGEVNQLLGNDRERKDIFVFLDGTKNTPASRTNVRRLHDLVVMSGNAQITTLYLQGVGTDYRMVSGAMLGRGMQDRILRAYRFIAENFSEGDRLFLFGFSRGAHQARALAGIVSYAGVPRTDGRHAEAASSIVEYLKRQVESTLRPRWDSWKPGQRPLLADDIMREHGIETVAAEIAFLGVWDTVPGSSFKGYHDCTERRGAMKKLFWWLPGIDRGERYKTGSYPAIRRIAHAVALDEKRSKFSPLKVCEPMLREFTQVTEVWFPGAHSDVGGGYDDAGATELADLSLKWMVDRLAGVHPLASEPELNGNAMGPAHWSICDSPGNIGSDCEDRIVPHDATLHEGALERRASARAWLRWSGKRRLVSYPMNCPSRCADPAPS